MVDSYSREERGGYNGYLVSYLINDRVSDVK